MQFAYYEKRNYLCPPIPESGQKTIKIYNDEKNISAFKQEEKEQARFP